MTITFKDTHTEEALSKLLAQFKEKDKLMAVLSAFTDQIQAVENVLQELLDERNIDVAVGDVLDLFGKVVGQPREGRTDDDFRLWIKARILINKSSGLTEEMYTVLKLITGHMDSGDFQLTETAVGYPAHFDVQTNFALGSLDPQVIYDILNEMRAITVDFTYTYALNDPIARYDVAGAGYDEGYYGQTI